MFFQYTAALFLSFPLLSLAGLQLNDHVRPGSVHAKRSFYIDPAGAGYIFPWPNGQLTWCLEGDSADSELESLFKDAWGKWNNAFGGPQRAKLSINYAGLCKEVDRQGHFLHVFLTDEKRAATIVGYTKPGHDKDGQPNQLMRFDKSSDWGTGSSASNLAHELGHAFGLWHEHQKWSAWNPDRLSDPPRENPLVKLNCENLADYDQFKKDGQPVDGLCRSVYMSQAYGFSAQDFLNFTQITTNHQSEDFDWDSIMIYGSTAGAKTVNGKKQFTLVKWDGSEIASVKEPSGRDGEAIRRLYPV
ncbi:MAG: hypothetical protein Q9186_005667 [Xanthomendoza sp. 1 TL-2023]